MITPGTAGTAGATLEDLHLGVTSWFASTARDLPWREERCSPWGILVSEVMLQQTPVVRVLPVWREWLERWPTPADLAAEPSGAAVRHWGRLGYPRRALRLHAAATAIVTDHSGAVPSTHDELLSLPGVGAYTAAAVAAFAFGRRETVVDTNIRRVHARLFGGEALPSPSLTRTEMKRAAALLPEDDALSVRWNAAVMELGAVVCTARSPLCDACPVLDSCAWVQAGRPAPTYVPRGQSWAGTDRQVRGAIVAVLREAEEPVPRARLAEPPVALSVDQPTDPGVDLGVDRGVGSGPDPLADPRTHPGADPSVDSGGGQLSLAGRGGAPGRGISGGALATLHALQAPPEQLERAIAGLLADGLAEESDGALALPG